MLNKISASRVLFVCLLTICALVTASSPQARSWNGGPTDDITNEGWSPPQVQDSPADLPLVQTADDVTNEGWVEPVTDDSTRDAPPAQQIDGVTNESLSTAQQIDSVTNEGLSSADRQERVDPSAAFANYTNYLAFSLAAGGKLSKISFTEVPVGTTLTNQYLNVHAQFTDGDDVTQKGTAYPTDNVGVDGKGRVHVRLTEPALAIGSDYPGALTIELWDRQGGTLLYTSSDFGGGGSGHFGGVVANTPFTFVVLRDWVDDRVFLDNIYLKDDLTGSDYRDLASFRIAAGGRLAKITFTEVPVGTTLADQYLSVHAQFTDGDDVTMASSNFLTDGTGVNGDGRVHLRLTEPAIAIGSDYPGALTIELWDRQGGTLLYKSSDFGGGGSGHFGGVVANTPFTFVVLRDWVDDRVYMDNIYLKDDLTGSDYRDLPSFKAAAGGKLATITFTEVPVGTTVTNHYLNVHTVFTDGDDVTLEDANFVTDNVGVKGDGRVHLRLTQPATAIGSDYPGALTIELWDHQGGTLLYTSSDFGGSGSGFFGGVVANTPFSFVVLRDWVDDRVFMDNIHIRFEDYRLYLPLSFIHSTGP